MPPALRLPAQGSLSGLQAHPESASPSSLPPIFPPTHACLAAGKACYGDVVGTKCRIGRSSSIIRSAGRQISRAVCPCPPSAALGTLHCTLATRLAGAPPLFLSISLSTASKVRYVTKVGPWPWAFFARIMGTCGGGKFMVMGGGQGSAHHLPCWDQHRIIGAGALRSARDCCDQGRGPRLFSQLWSRFAVRPVQRGPRALLFDVISFSVFCFSMGGSGCRHLCSVANAPGCDSVMSSVKGLRRRRGTTPLSMDPIDRGGAPFHDGPSKSSQTGDPESR